MQKFLASAALLALAALAGKGAAAAAEAVRVPFPLSEAWSFYTQRFIQADGRVIDHGAGGITTSEGQSYSMLRAVWVGDRAVSQKAYSWGRNNLNAQVRKDHLWAWKWGKAQDGRWRVLDEAFATDADQDVALALIHLTHGCRACPVRGAGHGCSPCAGGRCGGS